MSSGAPGPHESELSAEDDKLLTLAKAARARVRAVEGAAVRDETGRTYASSSITLASLQLTALEAAVAQAAAAGARRLESALVVCSADAGQPKTDAVAELGGSGIPVFTGYYDQTGQLTRLTQTST